MDLSAASPHIPPAALALPAAPLKESAQGPWVCCPRRKDPTWVGRGEQISLEQSPGLLGEAYYPAPAAGCLFAGHTLLEATGELHASRHRPPVAEARLQRPEPEKQARVLATPATALRLKTKPTKCENESHPVFTCPERWVQHLKQDKQSGWAECLRSSRKSRPGSILS